MSSYHYSERIRYGGIQDHRITRAVQRLILINAAVFAIQLLLNIPFGYRGLVPPPGGLIIDYLSFQPVSFLHGLLWQPLTYMFLHAGLLHLFFNMLWLYFFGPDVEHALGTRQFVLFYFLCGAVGVMATFIPLFIYGRDVSVVGASGAVMGVLIGFAIVNPHRQFFIFPLPVPITAKWLVAIVIVINLLNADSGGTMSVATHFGGMAVAYVYMKFIPYWRERRRAWWRGRRQGRGKHKNSIGDDVDNIFRFDKHRRD